MPRLVLGRLSEDGVLYGNLVVENVAATYG